MTVDLVRFSYHLIYLRRHLQSNFKPMLHSWDTHLHKWCHVLPFIHTKEKEFQKSVFVFYCLISKMVVYLNLYITDSCTPYQSTRREKVMFKFKKGCDFLQDLCLLQAIRAQSVVYLSWVQLVRWKLNVEQNRNKWILFIWNRYMRNTKTKS